MFLSMLIFFGMLLWFIPVFSHTINKTSQVYVFDKFDGMIPRYRLSDEVFQKNRPKRTPQQETKPLPKPEDQLDSPSDIQTISIASTSSPTTIQLNWQCVPSTGVIKVKPNICSAGQTSFSNAVQRIANVFQLSHPITITASFHSFCLVDNICNNDVLGFATPSSFYSIQGNNVDENYLYPQALAKQLAPGNFPERDIVANFNTDLFQRLWFSMDHKAITMDQTDFEYVVVHELLHGMGFTSSWNAYLQILQSQGMLGSNVITNYVIPNIEESTVDGQEWLGSFSYANIFDKFLFVSLANQPPTPLPSLYTELDSFCSPLEPLSQWIPSFSSSSEANIGAELYNASITPLTMFSYVGDSDFSDVNGTVNAAGHLMLHTRPFQNVGFRPGSSISHVDQIIYTNTNEFLMRPVATTGMTLANLQSQVGSVFGPKTLRLFAKMGYTIQGTLVPPPPTVGKVPESCPYKSTAATQTTNFGMSQCVVLLVWLFGSL